MLRVRAGLIAGEAVIELAAGRQVEDELVEGLADQITRDAAGLDLDSIAEALELAVAEISLPHGTYGLRMGALILVAPLRDRALRRFAGLHECAHAQFRALRFGHTHGDVWALTFALAMPRWVVARERGEIGAIVTACDAPWWAAEARLLMPGVTQLFRESDFDPHSCVD